MDVLTELRKLSDEELVERIRNGEEQAGDIIYERYKNLVRVKTRVYFLMGADREDILQEGMIGLVKAIRDYNFAHSSSFREFASMCITRNVLTAIKKASSPRHMPLNSYISLYLPINNEQTDVLLQDVIGDLSKTPEEAVESMEQAEMFFEYTKSVLTKLEHDVLRLFLNGFSYKSIAEQLGKGTKTIDNALQRIRKKLQQFSH